LGPAYRLSLQVSSSEDGNAEVEGVFDHVSGISLAGGDLDSHSTLFSSLPTNRSSKLECLSLVRVPGMLLWNTLT